MEKLFEQVYNSSREKLQECHFYEAKLIKYGKKIAEELKTNFNRTWARGVHFIEDIKYTNADHSWTIKWRGIGNNEYPMNHKEMLENELKDIDGGMWKTNMSILCEVLDNNTTKIYIPLAKSS